MNKIGKKLIAFVLVLSFALSPAAAIPARAQWIDIWNAAKEGGLDIIGWSIPKAILKKMTASTVNWINSGFQGRPAYLTNPQAYYTQMADDIAAQYIFSKPELNFLCEPVSAKIKMALSRSYLGLQRENWQCSPTLIAENFDNFMGDFSQGGWDAFYDISQRPQNNPIGAYLQAEGEMNRKIQESLNLKKEDLSWGQGFMSFQECDGGGSLSESCEAACADAGDNKTNCIDSCKNNISAEAQCQVTGGVLTTKTPGDVISKGLSNALNTGNESMVTADEINEMISALINQLVSQALGGVGGLLGSSGGSSSGGSSLTQQLLNEAADGGQGPTTDYFGNTQSPVDQEAPTIEYFVDEVNNAGGIKINDGSGGTTPTYPTNPTDPTDPTNPTTPTYTDEYLYALMDTYNYYSAIARNIQLNPRPDMVSVTNNSDGSVSFVLSTGASNTLPADMFKSATVCTPSGQIADWTGDQSHMGPCNATPTYPTTPTTPTNPSSSSLQFDRSNITTYGYTGFSTSVKISGGTPPYTILTAPNSSVATAEVNVTLGSPNVYTLGISVTGYGNTSITVKDSASTYQTATLPISISSNPPVVATPGPYSTATSDPDFTLDPSTPHPYYAPLQSGEYLAIPISKFDPSQGYRFVVAPLNCYTCMDGGFGYGSPYIPGKVETGCSTSPTPYSQPFSYGLDNFVKGGFYGKDVWTHYAYYTKKCMQEWSRYSYDYYETYGGADAYWAQVVKVLSPVLTIEEIGGLDWRIPSLR